MEPQDGNHPVVAGRELRVCIDEDCPACGWGERWLSPERGVFGCPKCDHESLTRTAEPEPDPATVGYLVTERRDGEVLVADEYMSVHATLEEARANLARYEGPHWERYELVLVELRELDVKAAVR